MLRQGFDEILSAASALGMKASSVGGASIRVVSARTGIPVDTLRVWERRYGFPKPGRREGGSRIYAEDDIARLQAVAAALSVGFRPGDVIPLPRKDVEALVEATRRDAAQATSTARAPAPPASDARPSSERRDMVGAVVDKLRADDVVGLRALLRSCAVTLGPRRFVTDLAHPLAVRVGELWADGVLDVRHEHLASATLSTQLRLLLGAFEDSERAPVVVLTTLPGEPHTLGLEMISVYLAAHSASPRLLGPDTPPDQIAAAARGMGADAAGIAVSPVADAAETAELARRLFALLPPRCELWVGGGGASKVTLDGERVRHVGSWQDLDDAIEASRRTRAA
jgi:DNA-binding transcriptional MerR regulator